MSQIIPIKIPTYISDATYAPARVLPRLFYYNGLVDCETYYIESGSLTNSGVTKELNAFPYFDNYNVVTGSFPTVNSKSLLFTNEAAAYGEVPTDSLYTEYWSKYISLLYNPVTRLVACEAIIPLADYFKMELNDIVQWRGNYYHLRAINDYNLSNGECNLQLLGPILDDVIGSIIPELACSFDFTIGCPPIPTTTVAPTTLVPTTLVPTTLVPTTTTLAPCALNIDYLVVAGGGGGGSAGGGGGGGGLISGSLTFVNPSFNIIVGAGGTVGFQQDGGNGATSSIYNTSTFISYSVLGGGGGGGVGRAGLVGGSGGGASYGTIAAVSGTLGQGNAGGTSGGDTAGGGGGASQAGIDGQAGGPGSISGPGGSGSVWLNGTFYAGGGGGGEINQPVSQGPEGGPGGGGQGGYQNGHPEGFDGTANTGGGGGGGSNGQIFNRNGGSGGSGIVIVRYPGSGSQATGGTISYSGSYTYHTFTSSGNFAYVGCPTTTLAPTTSTTTATP